MKVYVKKGEYQPAILGIIITIVFLSFSIGVFIYTYLAPSFIQGLSKVGISFVLAIILFVFGIYFLYGLFKKPKKYSARLISKLKENYNGKDITYMTFKLLKKENRGDNFITKYYNCFTYNDNDLIVNNIYNVYIKEFNWKIKKVDNEFNGNVIEAPNSTIKPVFIAIEFFIIANVLLGIMGLIYYKEYTAIYCLWIILFSIGIPYSINFFNQYEQDNKDEKINRDERLKNYTILNDNSKKINNLIVKDLLKYMFILPLLWFIVIYIMNSFTLNNIFLFLIPIVFLEFFLLVSILFYINYDIRLIRKYDLNHNEVKDIKKIKDFKIVRPIKNVTFEKYFIIDSKENNLMYNVQKTGIFVNRYFVYSYDGALVAEIRKKRISFSIEYIVRPVNIKPYSIRLKIQRQCNYAISGLNNYFVKGDISGTKNVIVNKDDEIIATITAQHRRKNWYELGNTDIQLYNYENNMDIILISLCVTIGNFGLVRNHFNS